MSTRLLLVRHGETPASIRTLFVGATEVDLTDTGRDQARAVAMRLRHVRIDALYVSPLRRCLQTAAPIADSTGLKVRTEPLIRECDFGEWEGLSGADVVQKDAEGLRQWLAEDSHSSHGGESWAQLGERVWSWWLEASERHREETICAVTHGGPIRSLLRQSLRAPYHALLTIEIDPASISLLQTQGPVLRVRFVNDTAHLGDALRPSEPPSELPP